METEIAVLLYNYRNAIIDKINFEDRSPSKKEIHEVLQIDKSIYYLGYKLTLIKHERPFSIYALEKQ